ncbi:MAG: SoxR reducing system RseC family protein [Bacteroidales bacterium]|nr:SoxR reducing system RseC family protein [Bacteroidales bacterium]MDD4685470.1 SoxR reducing system RseC family protein [Bacteroidales bacterium]
MSELIEHSGTICEIIDSKVVVRIISASMCASCHAKGACSMNDTKEKCIDVNVSNPSDYKVGQEVVVCLEQKMGTKAVLIGFFFPFLTLIITAILSNKYIFPNNEALTALLSILSITVYYIIIYLIKNKIEKKFHFQIK